MATQGAQMAQTTPDEVLAAVAAHATSDSEKEVRTAAVFIDSLQNDDLAMRMKAVANIKYVATILGPQRCRDEFIPYVAELIDDEDEVLCELTKQLGGMLDLIGGPEHIHHLLLPLEGLAKVEEGVVREGAMSVVQDVLKQMPVQQLTTKAWEMGKRLASADWYSARVSATVMVAWMYLLLVKHSSASVDRTKAQLIETYQALCDDDTPMVRRSACKSFPDFIKAIGSKLFLEKLLSQWKKLAVDAQDSVRLLVVESIEALGEVCTKEEMELHIYPSLRSLVNDRSWRVRYMCASRFPAISKRLPDRIVKETLLTQFVQILRDPEAEVRAQAAAQVALVGKSIGVELSTSKLLPLVSETARDSSKYPRASLASVIFQFAATIQKSRVITDVVPIYKQLLEDANSEVRLNVISRIDMAADVVGAESLADNILPAILNLCKDLKWRVRLEIISKMPLVAKALGKTFFEGKLIPLLQEWLGDDVCAVRECIVKNLGKVAQVFGTTWARQHLVPEIRKAANASNYLHRMTALSAAAHLLTIHQDDKAVGDDLLPVLMEKVDDKVPNVRLFVCKQLRSLLVPTTDGGDTSDSKAKRPLPSLTPEACGLLRARLAKLLNDSDIDVQFFASQTLAAVPV